MHSSGSSAEQQYRKIFYIYVGAERRPALQDLGSRTHMCSLAEVGYQGQRVDLNLPTQRRIQVIIWHTTAKKKKKERNTSQAVETGKEMKWERDEEGEQASICFAVCGLPQTHPAHESVHTVSFNLHIRFHSYFHIYLACVARTAVANNLLGLMPVSKIVVPACKNTDFRCGPRQSSTWVMWRLFTAMKRRHNVI